MRKARDEAQTRRYLLILFRRIHATDQDCDYERRNEFIMEAINPCLGLGYPVGFRFDPEEPDWPVIYFELPTGQVAWHLTMHPTCWDGHTRAEKYQRIHEYANGPQHGEYRRIEHVE